MSTLIVLTPEQAELVRHGVLPDSSFRPMPQSTIAAFESRAGRRRWERRATRVRPAENRHRIEFLDRDVAAAHWKQQTVELALLIANVDLADRAPGADWAVFALARANALGRRGSGTTGVRKLEIRDWRLLPTPVLVDDIMDDLPTNEARWWRENLYGPSKPIPPSTNETTLNALRSRVPGFDEIAAAVRRLPTPTGGIDVATVPSLQEARDAGISAMRVFSPDWRDLQPTQPSDQPLSPELEQFVAQVDENDLIQDDIVPFEDWQQYRSQGGWVEFQSAGRRLLVKNFNFKRIETATGADLIYWRNDPDAFVIVQYKVLVKDNKGFIHRINGQDRLPRQLQAMLACTESDGAAPSTTVDFRLANTSAFVKFAYPMTKPHADHQLIEGHYLPADYVRLMYARPDIGQAGAKLLRFPTERSIDPETFSRLVRDCWIGTSGTASAALHKLLPGLRQHPPAHLLVAYDEPLRRQNAVGQVAVPGSNKSTSPVTDAPPTLW